MLRFHTNGGPIIFTGQTHSDFTAALEQISLDRENKAHMTFGSGPHRCVGSHLALDYGNSYGIRLLAPWNEQVSSLAGDLVAGRQD